MNLFTAKLFRGHLMLTMFIGALGVFPCAAEEVSPPGDTVTLPDVELESIGAESPGISAERGIAVENDPDAFAAPIETSVPVGTWEALELLGLSVAPGTRAEAHWTAGQSFAGSAIETPVVVIRGRRAGPCLCLTAAVHGDELNGVEIVRQVLEDISPEELAGTVIGVPIVNLLGFTRGSRYLPDRRDLNRHFPGHPRGSSASRIAGAFFSKVVSRCDRLVDFHTGSFKRTNLPQLRADLTNPAVREFVEHFGATTVLHKPGGSGTLRGAATAAGIPAVAFELGEPGTLQMRHVKFGVKAVETLLDKLGMVDRFRLWTETQPVYYRSRWLRAYRGGILTSDLKLGASIARGELLGFITNPLSNRRSEIRSPADGRLLGRALDQFVLPGFAIFHIGIVENTETTGGTVEKLSATDNASEIAEQGPAEPPSEDDEESDGDPEALVPIDADGGFEPEDEPH